MLVLTDSSLRISASTGVVDSRNECHCACWLHCRNAWIT